MQKSWKKTSERYRNVKTDALPTDAAKIASTYTALRTFRLKFTLFCGSSIPHQKVLGYQ